mgnify:FL=1
MNSSRCRSQTRSALTQIVSCRHLMSLTDRLSRLAKTQTEEDSMMSFKAMTLEEMGQTPITFGKAHVGKNFMEIWTVEKQWLMWFTKTYASSSKTDHMKLLHYTELMVSQAETEAESDQQQMPLMQPHPKPKAKGKASNPTGIPMPEMFEAEPWMESELVYVPPSLQQEELTVLQDRMSSLEGAMTEILNHLRQG